MSDLRVNKSGFDSCYEALKNLSSKLQGAAIGPLDMRGDTSITAEKERLCYEELKSMISDLAALVDVTAQNLKSTQENYISVDK